jgi:hypothetical protein
MFVNTMSDDCVKTTGDAPKRRRSVAWRQTAPVHTPHVPFEVCIESACSLDDVHAQLIEIGGGCTNAFSAEAWQTLSPLFRASARAHFLYPIVITGDTGASKKCAQASLRRLEELLDWCASLADTPETLAILDRQTRYGLSRQRGRKPRHTPEALVACPSANPSNLESLLSGPLYLVVDAILLGCSRTIRVYDTTGCCIWLVPSSTLAAFNLSAPPVPVKYEPADDTSTVGINDSLYSIEGIDALSTADVCHGF